MAEIFASQWENAAGVQDGEWDTEVGADDLTVSNAQALEDTNSLKVLQAWTAHHIGENVSVDGKTTLGIRFGIYVDAFSNFQYIFYLSDTIAAGIFMSLTIDNASMFLECSDSDEVMQQIGNDYAYALDTWYQVEILWVDDTSIKWKIWNAAGDGLVLAEQSSADVTDKVNTAGLDVQVGNLRPRGAGTIIYVDSFVIDDAGYPGPYTPSAGGPTAKAVAGSLAVTGALARKLMAKRTVAGVL